MASHLRRSIVAVILWLFLTGSAFAQSISDDTPPAVLVADEIELTRERILIARGNVEAFQGQVRMTAKEVEYNPDTGQLIITGPITIQDGDDVTILANQAELNEDLQNGLLTGARLVLDNQLQLASLQMNRLGGRYTQLYKTVATSCRICEDETGPPLWQIRARRVVHDREERQLYFDHAQLRVLDFPILYLPQLRLPDPTVERATGFLVPELSSNTLLGTGIRVPYFIALGDHRDLTLTPFISNDTRTLEFRYRQAFVRGHVEFEGALSDDDLRPNSTRAFLFGVGEFALNRGFILQFDIEATSDDSYLYDYDYTSKDRLDSEIRLSRTQRDEYIRLSYIKFKSLRDDEDDDNIPTDVIDAVYDRRFHPAGFGGEFRLTAVSHAHFRNSNTPFDTDGDGSADGLDVKRLNVDATWLRLFQFGGLQVQTSLGLSADVFDIEHDDSYPGSDSGLTQQAGVVFRYPMVRHDKGGVTQMIEPIAQFSWVGGDNLNVPNDESTRVEFDEGNLLTMSRFPAPDRRERGWAAVLGGTWARYDPDGWSARMTLGQIFREEDQQDFTRSSGLAGISSDVLLAGAVQMNGGLFVSGRTIFDTNFDIAKAEVRGNWSNDRFDLEGTYVWLAVDRAENRPDPINELTLDGAYRIDRFWTANFDWRYDIAENRSATTGAGLTYTNECVSIDFSINRRFADSTTVEPSTNLGFTVALRGFSANSGTESYVRSCGKQAK